MDTLPTLPWPDAEICNVGYDVDASGWYMTVTRDRAFLPVPVGRNYGSIGALAPSVLAVQARVRAVRRLLGREFSWRDPA